MFLSYFKKFPEKDRTLEVIVEFPDDGGNTGNVIDTIVHPLDYEPKGETVYQKEDNTKNVINE